MYRSFLHKLKSAARRIYHSTIRQQQSKVDTTGEWPIFFTAAPEGRSIPFQIDPPDTDGEVLECFSTEDDDRRPLSAKELHLKIWS